MASRFVAFAEEGEADYTVCGVGFRYLDLSEEEAASVRAQASAYKVRMTEIERYSHEEYGDYESVSEMIEYEFDEMRSLSEKVWQKTQGLGDIIVENGVFDGVVFFTGFPDYREREELGVIPLEHIGSRKGLSDYVSVDFGILRRVRADDEKPSRHIAGSENGRVTTSYNVCHSLIKK